LLFVEVEVEEEETEVEHDNNRSHIENQTVTSNKISAKMTYQYPKERSVRFPVIPDEMETKKRTGRRQVEQSKEKDQQRPRLRAEKPATTKKTQPRSISKKENKPFVPTEVPSPIYGLQKREETKPIVERPAYERKRERNQVQPEKKKQEVTNKEYEEPINDESVDQPVMREEVEVTKLEQALTVEPDLVQDKVEIQNNQSSLLKNEEGKNNSTEIIQS